MTIADVGEQKKAYRLLISHRCRGKGREDIIRYGTGLT
jgi:hypothetical protein